MAENTPALERTTGALWKDYARGVRRGITSRKGRRARAENVLVLGQRYFHKAPES